MKTDNSTQVWLKKQKSSATSFWLLVFVLYAGLSGFRPHAWAESLQLFVLGDSLTAGYGLQAQEAFPAQLQQKLAKRGHEVRVINGGVSGDTSHAALRRLSWVLPANTDAAIVELGGNDALRGLSPARTYQALEDIITYLQNKNIKVLLAGMLAPPNMGPRYSKEFNALFPTLAKKYNVLFYPFFLADVYGDEGLMLDDGIHPNAAGVAIIAENILPEVELLLAQIAVTQ